MNLLEKYAKLIVVKGANVQPQQTVVLNISPEHYEFARLIIKQAYEQKAKDVIVVYRDSESEKYGLIYQDIETLTNIPNYVLERYQYYIDNKACFIHVISEVPDLLQDVDPEKIQAVTIANGKAMSKFRYYTMSNHGQWTIAALPNKKWAKKIFPELSDDDACNKLLEEILKTVRVKEETDVIDEWNKHNEYLTKYSSWLNEKQFDFLHFESELGTDIYIGLVKNHIWRGGQDLTLSGVAFNPNLPTEEVFSMPDRHNVNGIVYASKPLSYQGGLIEDFFLEFKDGKVVNYGAKKGQELLKNLLESDEDSTRLGEVALISYNTPISQSNILYYNTLFDENASCHVALGAAYPTCMKNGENLEPEDFKKAGGNISMVHVDFMFGTPKMNITGIKDGEKTKVFENGNFVI